MSLETPLPRKLPDVAGEKTAEKLTPLDWVGMKEIEIPVKLEGADGVFRQAARADAQVSLDQKPSRGIHMSRLYLLLQEALSARALSFDVLRALTDEFLRTHDGLSSSARVEVRLPWPLRRQALKSGFSAWRTYPVTMSFENRAGETAADLEVLVTYSSTCPASAALSRQIIQDQFRSTFSGTVQAADVGEWLGTPAGMAATPHAQRSEARVKVRLAPGAELTPEAVIDLVEEALQTAVQGAVKREDEQEFARRNGHNLMFCEDAARRVAAVLEGHAGIADYVCEFNHIESLHPHNAVSRVSRGLPGGLR